MPPRPDSRAAEPFAPPTRGGWRAYAAMLAGNAMLALGPWSVRLADVGPVASGFWRVALALPFLALIARRATARAGQAAAPGRWSRATIVAVAVAGACFALDLAAWHAGIGRTRLANATLFGNTASFFFTIYAFARARTWPSRVQAAALALAVAGVALLMGRSLQLSPDHIAGDLLCLAAGLFYTGYMIGVDRVRPRIGNWPTLAAATVAATAVLLPLALVVDGDVVPHRWWPLVALAIGSQVIGQGLLVYSIGALPPQVVGLGLLTQPAVAAVIGWLAYGERLTAGDIVGACAIAAALLLIRGRSPSGRTRPR